MTQKEFIEKIRAAYIAAREFVYTPTTNLQALTRGTSHSISSLTEDLFGCYCTEKIANSDNIKIHIDPQLSFRGTGLKNKSGKKSLLIRPDLLLTNNSVANCMFDIKTDLGYKRNELYNQAKERNDQIDIIKNETAFCKDGKSKVEEKIKFSNEIKFIYIVLSQGNINKTVQDSFIKNIRNLAHVDIFLLTTGDHLNAYHENPKWEINQYDFDRLDKTVEISLCGNK